ncbi:MAG TPA: DNA translocase FtsK 4TM domain-containing protein, partial [Flavobacteriaceae bacterium]|nr:DNA translocase FtsK 4TM domain-containing protein [Flavobacteriaceae bacterium]
ASTSHFLVYNGFGIAAIWFSVLLFLTGLAIFLKVRLTKLKSIWGWGILGIIWLSISLGFIAHKNALLPGIVGYETNIYLKQFLGEIGLILVLIFLLLSYLVIRFKLTPELLKGKFKRKIKNVENTSDSMLSEEENTTSKKSDDVDKPIKEIAFDVEQKEDNLSGDSSPKNISLNEEEIDNELDITLKTIPEDKDVEISVDHIVEENHVEENLSDKLIKDFGEFDPTLELGNYKFPTLNLLRDYNEIISVDQEELEANKNRIVDTLKNYNIGIERIKATVGPTVTLYEIVPEAGIRISKIKNLEDDIALSLSALGIRIIAPIPGKGTIGIEVPNKKPTMVSMKSVISSTKFQNSEMDLPIALGKTISNETFVVDLAKMPHLLMAGATGQGKSVGLNAVLASLLYKKHPAEVKFVLVDPKKVELSLFNKIERHYLAKLPDSEEAIITDTTKVINTLNSLCIEMDARYDLLKTAYVRTIKEYNKKFKKRKLNPENGHRYLPYIVLVIDEFADLIMTAGKEIETPIARLAQLARAVGIHLIVATQRPSVNVITGIIKANFPSRAAFRVTSKIDSRTILDGPGADQLIGKGDMLYSGGNDVIRLQCAFIDTPEVDKITDFIGSQRAYPEAHLLPEYSGEEVGTSLDIDISERDKLFRDAAILIVQAQQGSTSLLQRKLKLGYNRAGRIIDQLEAAGIVGPFEGSKARQVLITDERALNELLDNEKK